MSRHLLTTLILILVLPFAHSCSDDSDDYIIKPDPDAYRSLTLRDNVLFNLEKAWNERNIDKYDQLLDEGFVFFFSVADVKNGDVSVSHWGRSTEIAVVGNMWDPNFSKPGQVPVSSINLALTYAEGEDVWEEVVPDQDQYPGETWYSKVFRYTLTVEAGYFTYIGNNIQATVIVRWADVDGEEFWRIVMWSDDTESQLQESEGAPALTQDTTWGQIKTLFVD